MISIEDLLLQWHWNALACSTSSHKIPRNEIDLLPSMQKEWIYFMLRSNDTQCSCIRCRVRLYENNKTEQKHSLSKDCNPRSMDVSKLHYSLLTSIAAGVVGYTISFLYVTLCSQAFAIAVFSVYYSKSNLKGFHGNRPFLCGWWWWWWWFTRFSSLFFELIIFTKMSRSICNLVHGGHFFLRNIGFSLSIWEQIILTKIPRSIWNIVYDGHSFLKNICGVTSFCPYFT